MQPEAEFVRYVLPFVVGFGVSIILGPGIIAALKQRRVGQTISADGPESHQSKAGTPTMGGLIIIAGMLAGVMAIVWAFGELGGTEYRPSGLFGAAGLTDLLAVVLLVGLYVLVGLADDYLTIHPVGGVRGIASKPKAAAQLLLAIAFVMWLATARTEPFVPALYLGGTPILTGVAYWVFAVLFIAGMANFVNIADGLDGLVSGLTAIACVGFVFTVGMVAPRVGIESIRLLMLLMATGGACMAFLWFNSNPAQVFMGDTGSLALGVALPAVAIITHREILMILVGLVFVLDGFSTIIQWAVFKYTRITTGTGRRVFKKSPIHHHFELCGWAEQKVVVRFWIAGVLAAVLGFAGATYRLW